MSLVDISSLPVGLRPGGTPRLGAYLTDDTRLYRVERLLADRAQGKVLLELEDCASLDIVLCPARPLAVLGLRPVTPAHAGDGEPSAAPAVTVTVAVG